MDTRRKKFKWRFKSKIKEMLKEQGLSIRWLAEQAGITYAALHRHLKPEYLSNAISLDTVFNISRVLGVTIEELFDIEEIKTDD